MRELPSTGMQPAVCFPGTAQHPLESLAEIRAPAVDDGVEGGIGIAQPVEEDKELVWYQASVEHPDHVDQEKGQPAESEDAHDDAECL